MILLKWLEFKRKHQVLEFGGVGTLTRWWGCKTVPLWKNRLAHFYKGKHVLSIWPYNPRYLPNRSVCVYIYIYVIHVSYICHIYTQMYILFVNVQSTFIHNFQRFETIQIFNSRWLDTQILVCSHNGVQLRNKKNEVQMHATKKQDTEDYTM